VRPFESAAQSKSLATCRFPAHPRGKARVLGQA
jgi:hypothetical protein